MSIQLSINPGLVSVFYFVFLDLVLLTNLDAALSRVLSHFYYRQIYSGRPLLLRTVDVPGITSFLLGRRLSLANAAAILVKLLFMLFIFMMDINIQADNIERVHVLSTFEMNATEEAWGDGVNIKRNVERRWDASRRCFVAAKPREYHIGEGIVRGYNDSIMYYHLAFNLTKGYEFTKDETLPVSNTSSNGSNNRSTQFIPINDRALQCLRPGLVLNPRPLIRVVGCSNVERLLNTSCDAYAPTSRSAASLSFTTSPDDILSMRNQSGHTYTSEAFLFDTFAELQPVFPEYVGPGKRTELFCLKQGYTVPRLIWPKIRTWCLLVMHYNNITLFERWTYHRSTNTVNRTFPGPIFDRDIDVGVFQMANFVWNAQNNLNWRVLSGVIVAESSVYVFEPKDVELIRTKGTETEIRTEAIVMFFVMIVAVVVIRLAVYYGVEREGIEDYS